MTFNQLIFRNVVRNGRVYATYLFSSLFSVFIFYLFSMLYFHPQLTKRIAASSDTMSELAGIGLKTAQVVIIILALIFLWYTFMVFLKARKRDLSVYLLLGIEERDLRWMIFLENTLLGLISTVGGIGLGVLFTKFVLLISQQLLSLADGLHFYLPVKPVLLTFGLFFLIFLWISFASLVSLRKVSLVSLMKADEQPRPEPKATWYWMVLGIGLILAGYGTVFYAVWVDMQLHYLLLCVLLTIAGTILFFYQSSVYLLKFLKTRSLALRGTNLLSISELIYRMRDNALMYSLITIVASVAFVGIGVSWAVGGSDFAATQGPSFSYVLNGFGADKEAAYFEGLVDQVEQLAEAEGSATTKEIIRPIYLDLGDTPLPTTSVLPITLALLPASQYQRLAKATDLPLYQPQDQELILFATSNTDVAATEAMSAAERKVTVSGVLEEKPVTFDVEKVTTQFNLNTNAIGVIADDLYQQYALTGERSMLGVVQVADWQDKPKLDQKIRAYLQKETQYNEEHANYDEISETVGPNEFVKRQFFYTSLYQVWQENRQANGLILMIAVLLGSVFFTFAASILYFRLFGDIQKDGAYHRALHVLGTTQEERHQLVRKQMQIMYFVPPILAAGHFAVALLALQQLAPLPVWRYYGWIVCLFFAFQLVFYYLSKRRYLNHLDHLAEPF